MMTILAFRRMKHIDRMEIDAWEEKNFLLWRGCHMFSDSQCKEVRAGAIRDVAMMSSCPAFFKQIQE